MRPGLLVPLATLVACADASPPTTSTPVAVLTCGSLDFALQARIHRACESETWSEQNNARTVPLIDSFRGSVVESGNSASLEATCSPPSRALRFASTVERTCGTHCAGGAASVAFTWAGTLELPTSSAMWRVRLSIEAIRNASGVSEQFTGQCEIQTPWRSPIVVDSERMEREMIATAGVAPLRVVCARSPEPRVFVALACFGAPSNPRPGEVSPPTVTATLSLRIDVSPS